MVTVTLVFSANPEDGVKVAQSPLTDQCPEIFGDS